jgi:hypothetical protein
MSDCDGHCGKTENCLCSPCSRCVRKESEKLSSGTDGKESSNKFTIQFDPDEFTMHFMLITLGSLGKPVR